MVVPVTVKFPATLRLPPIPTPPVTINAPSPEEVDDVLLFIVVIPDNVFDRLDRFELNLNLQVLDRLQIRPRAYETNRLIANFDVVSSTSLTPTVNVLVIVVGS